MATRWGAKNVVLHWVSAALLIGMAVGGFVMSDLPADSSGRLLIARVHTAVGFTLMAVTVVRLVVRWRGPKPEPLPLPALHRRGIAFVHGTLYATIFALGATGVSTAAQSAWPAYLRGELSAVPDLAELGARQAHETLVFVFLGLLALHVGGVFVQEIRGGRTLRRMLPLSGPSPHGDAS